MLVVSFESEVRVPRILRLFAAASLIVTLIALAGVL